MSLSFPTLPDSLDACTAFRLPLHLWLGMCTGDLGWGPRTRHLVLYYISPAAFLGWKSCCKQENRRRRVYMYTGRKGLVYRVITESTNARKHGINGRQGKIGNLKIKSFRRQSPSGDLRCFFLPLMQYRCYLEGYILYCHSRLPWRFFVSNLRDFVCIDLDGDHIGH